MLGSGWGMICILQSSGTVMSGGDQGPEDSHGMEKVVKRPRVKEDRWLAVGILCQGKSRCKIY
jgi:hypothetical protein